MILGGHAHTTKTTFGVADTVFDRSWFELCGSGGIRCCAHYQQLGPLWGIGGNAPTPQGWQDTGWSPWGATHTHHQDHIRRCRHRIRPFMVRIVRIGCRTVVYTPSSAARAAMGHWGQCPHTLGMAGHWLITLGATHAPPCDHIRRCRHRIRPFVVRIARFGCRTVVCTPSSAARAAMGHWGQWTHTPRMAGH